MAAVLALISAAMWGLADFIAGTATRRLKALAVVGASQFFGLLSIAAFAAVTGAFGSALDDTRWVLWAVASSLTGFVGLALLYAALATGVMGIVSPIASLGVMVPLIAGVLAGEKPSAAQGLGVALALVGIVLASGPELTGGAPVRPVALATGAALLLGTSLFALARGSEYNVTMTLVGMRALTVSILLAAALLLRTAGGVTAADVPVLAVIGFFDVAANLTFGVASTLGLLTIVSVLGSLYPVTTVLLARFVHHERLRAIQYVGVVAALAGVGFISGG